MAAVSVKDGRIIYGQTGLEKRFPFLRYFYPPWQGRKTKRCRKVLNSCLEEARREGKLVLNVGSGLRYYGSFVINLDQVFLPNVSVLGSAEALPIDNESVGGAILEHVLEHVPNPEQVLAEVARVLSPGGWFYLETPFIVPYHEGPYDFRRWTLVGLKHLAGDSFSVEESGVAMGPGTALMHLLRETFATALSFNNLIIYRIIRVVTGWFTFWLKYIDVFLQQDDQFGHICAAGLFVLLRRR